MGRKYVHTFRGADKHGLVIEIICKGCGRTVYRSAYEMIGFQTRAGHRITGETHIADIGRFLRCQRCRTKGAGIVPRWPAELNVPPGIPALPFLNGDDRERKRLIRIARG